MAGLIVALGNWVLNAACAQNVAWQREGLPALRMAVNLSARQLADEDLLKDVAEALEQSGMNAQLLELELTESVVMQNADRGKTLNLIVVAEGVETLEQETFLREHGCDETQGYYFSRPIASDQFAELLRLNFASHWK